MASGEPKPGGGAQPLSFKDRMRQRAGVGVGGGGGSGVVTPQVLSPVPEELQAPPPAAAPATRLVTSPKDGSIIPPSSTSAATTTTAQRQRSPLMPPLQPREPRPSLSPAIVTLTLGGSSHQTTAFSLEGGGGGGGVVASSSSSNKRNKEHSPLLEKSPSGSSLVADGSGSVTSPTAVVTRGRSGSKSSSNPSPSGGNNNVNNTSAVSAAAPGFLESSVNNSSISGMGIPQTSFVHQESTPTRGGEVSTLLGAEALSRSAILNRSRSREKILPRRSQQQLGDLLASGGGDDSAGAGGGGGGGGAFAQLRSPMSPASTGDEQLFVSGTSIVRRKSTSNFSSLKYSASGRRMTKDLARQQLQQIAESASDLEDSSSATRGPIAVHCATGASPTAATSSEWQSSTKKTPQDPLHAGGGGGGGASSVDGFAATGDRLSAAGTFARDAIVEALVQLQETPEYVLRTQYQISTTTGKGGAASSTAPPAASVVMHLPSSPTRPGAAAVDFALAEAAAVYGAYSPTADDAPASKFSSCTTSPNHQQQQHEGGTVGGSSSCSAVNVTLTFLDQTAICREAEVGRYMTHQGPGSNCGGGGGGPGTDADFEGACMCSQSTIQKDIRGFDYSQYHAHRLFYECDTCKRQPSSFLCLQCLKSFCPSHVQGHFTANNPNRDSNSTPNCSLFINLHDISTSFDRVFWCEACRRFTWKYTEVYEPLTEQICFTKGTYWGTAIRDVHAIGYSMMLPRPALAASAAVQSQHPLRVDVVSATTQGWRSTQEDAECMFLASFTFRDVMGFLRRSSQTTKGHNQKMMMTMEALRKLMFAQGDEDIPVAFVGVFDGHGGDQVAKLAAASLERLVKQKLLSARSGASPIDLLRASDNDESPILGDDDSGGGRVTGTALSLQFDECVDADGAALRQRDDVVIALDGDDDDDNDVMTSNDNNHSCADQQEQQLTPAERKLVLKAIEKLFRRVVQESLLALDLEIRDSAEGRRGDYNCVGCTCCLVGVSNDFILCGNCGDSGAAVFTPSSLEMLSVPHRLSDEKERARVRAAGYSISEDERIEGLLAVPRALGDYDFKQCGGKSQREQAVTALADVTLFEPPQQASSWGVVVACDGVWDTATRQQVQHALTPALRRPSSSSEVEEDEPLTTSAGGTRVVLSDSFLTAAARDGSTDERGGGLETELLVGCGRVFVECVAPTCNDEGVGVDNVSCIVVKCLPIRGTA